MEYLKQTFIIKNLIKYFEDIYDYTINYIEHNFIIDYTSPEKYDTLVFELYTIDNYATIEGLKCKPKYEIPLNLDIVVNKYANIYTRNNIKNCIKQLIIKTKKENKNEYVKYKINTLELEEFIERM